MGLENIRNLLKEVPPEQLAVRFLINGKGAILFRKDRIGEGIEPIKDLILPGTV